MNSNTSNKGSDKNSGNLVLTIIKYFFKSLGTLLATFIMVGIITGCIVGSILTVYVLQSIGAEEPVKLESIKLGYTSKIYAMDSKTKKIKKYSSCIVLTVIGFLSIMIISVTM